MALIFDTHAHYDSEKYNDDRDIILESMAQRGVGAILNVGATFKGCLDSVMLAEKYPFLYAAVGVHPDEVGCLDEEKLLQMEQMLTLDKVIAVGEIGLDYHWMVETEEVQKYWFVRQLEVANRKNMPVSIHSREATQDTFDIIKEYGNSLKGSIHCFSGSKEMAKNYVDMGFCIGVGGVVTFKNARKLKEVVEQTPLASILLETDCPYLAPVPYRGERNDSSMIEYVAKEIAAIKDITLDEVIETTWNNAHRVFNL